jgi:hypothetical protein
MSVALFSRRPGRPGPARWRRWRRWRAASCVFVVAVGALSAACQTGRFADDRFENNQLDFTVGQPGDGWTLVKQPVANVAWHNPALGGALLVNGHCEGVQDSPLPSLTSQLLHGTTEREVRQETVMPFARREGLLTIVDLKLDGVPRRRALFVVKKDGCVYDLVYDAPPGRFDEGYSAFERVKGGMVIGPRRDR